MNNPPAQPEHEVPRMMMNLCETIAECEKEMLALSERLSLTVTHAPVPPPPNPKKEETVEVRLAPLAEDIRAQANRVGRIRELIKDLQDRLEV